MKAFLSHSSQDKEFVRAVAKELGRQYCVFDEQSFENGEEFKSSIEKRLDDSSVFVLFASKKALESVWVKFEMDEAWFRKLHNNLSKSLVYLIESSVSFDNIPEWLKRGLIQSENVPKRLARDIKHQLDELQRNRQNPYFVGRSKEVNELEQILTPIDASIPPHFVFITGLPGIGRRSLIRKVSPSILNLRKQVELRIGEGDSVNDICITIADHSEPYSTQEGLKRIVEKIQKLTDEEAIQRIIENLRALVAGGELPIFLDEGGLLDEEGYIRKPIELILRSIIPNDTLYIFFVSHRRPQQSFDFQIPVIQVGHLGEEGTKRLILLLAKQDELEISLSETSDLANFIAGYPPAAYYAIQQAKDYGIELVIGEKAHLVGFRTSVFLKHLSKISLSETETQILQLLALYSPLPLPVISQVLSQTIESMHKDLVRLIDLALLITTQNGFYRIADPIADASVKTFGYPSDETNKLLARSLYSFLQKSEFENARLELSRVMFRVALLANDREVAQSATHLANDLIRLTETYYHKRDYNEAEKCGLLAIDQRPDNASARSYLIRALIQQEKWKEAELQLGELQKYTPIREIYYLWGFLERKQGRLSTAIEYYKKALNAGRKGAAVNRELALCYYSNDNLDMASKYISEALKAHGDNPYVVDLWIQIAIKQGKESEARDALSRLKIIDDPLYYLHRLSKVEFSFGYTTQALEASRKAVNGSNRPAFEMLVQLITCEIEDGNLDEAEKLLTQIDRKFGNIRRDIRVSLRCRYEIARGKYSEALAQSERIGDKNNFFYKKIRLDALRGELKYSALPDSLRNNYEKEVNQLEGEIATTAPRKFIPIELDSFA